MKNQESFHFLNCDSNVNDPILQRGPIIVVVYLFIFVIFI